MQFVFKSISTIAKAGGEEPSVPGEGWLWSDKHRK
jgi:hypothetical protein